ncbi:MAG: 16S rRNA (cytidine(1402)-2'-O)-methyltransferase [Oscillospiraceae bacterium]|jgi:16S rRNA (cytidine1402-2'-O)-methyltransferase|nr:16S rRNA (cytidine(1402)-2'-O)-methyltransferase [Oscillospiraceae bacterium]
MSGILYLVGTPIGNLADFSPRAAETLQTVDFIACEDTRVTMKLLSRFDIHRPLVSYHEHNRRESGDRIVERLHSGESCALVTDAGMPAISDPGEDLVRLCGERGITVIAIPGPSALTAAVALSGLTGGRFTFEGFLSTAARARREHLASLRNEPRAMVFYEAPHKLTRTLADMLQTLGDRRISISRELTKIHEETWRGTLSDAVARFDTSPPRGEFVLVVEGAPKIAETPDLDAAIALARSHIARGMSVRDAARQVSVETGVARNALYFALTESEES